MKVKVSDDGKVICSVFLLCNNPAVGTIRHPILDYVPSCERCANKLGHDIIPTEFEVTE